MINKREHWAVRRRRVVEERLSVRGAFRGSFNIPPLGTKHQMLDKITITLTRLGMQTLDDDNLRSALKTVRDQVTEEMGFVNDRDQRITWLYDQRPGGLVGVEVVLEG